jgi:hypothetical protein
MVVTGATIYSYVLATGAERWGTSTYNYPGVGFVFDLDAGYDEAVASTFVYQNAVSSTSGPIGDAIDMLSATDRVYISINYYYGASPGNTYLMLREATWNAASSSYTTNSRYFASENEDYFHDIDVRADAAGNIWAVGCGDAGLTFAAAYSSGTSWTSLGGSCNGTSPDCNTTGYGGASTCFFNSMAASGATTSQATSCTGSACTTWDLFYDTSSSSPTNDTVTTSASQPYTSRTWTSVSESSGWMVYVDSSGVTVSDGSRSYTELRTYTVSSAEAATDASGDLYIVAVVSDETGDGKEDIVLAYGTPGGLTEVIVPLTDGTRFYDALYASIWVDSSRVFVAASGLSGTATSSSRTDVVAWMFMAPP